MNTSEPSSTVSDGSEKSNYAAVSADTFSSELGILSKSKPRLLTSWNFRQVPPGTNGGVTLAGTLAGFAGAFVIALTSVILLPFCSDDTTIRGKLFGNNSGFEAGSGWGWQEKIFWVVAVTIWGGLGSVLDSALGGLLQASVVDGRTGKVIEGTGGKKVSLLFLMLDDSLMWNRCSCRVYNCQQKRRATSQVAESRAVSDFLTIMGSTCLWLFS